MKTYNIDYFFPQDSIYQLSSISKKPVIYFRADGPNNCKDEERKNEVWDFYFNKCDESILAALQQNGEVYCYFMTEEQAVDAFNEWFPQKSDLMEEEMHFYVHAHLVFTDNNIDILNGI